MYSQYQCLPCYKYQIDEVERNLSYKCTVLCYILEYMYILQITKRRIGPVLAFNVQIPDQVECLAVFACWKQAQDLFVSLLFVQHWYIFQYVTQNSTFTRQNTLSFIILVLIIMLTLVSGVHVCNKVIYMDSIHQARLAQSVEHQTWNRRVVGSSRTVDKEFCILSLPTHSWQVDWSHANEIKHDVHPRYIGA